MSQEGKNRRIFCTCKCHRNGKTYFLDCSLKLKKNNGDSFKQITYIKYPWKSKTNALPNQDERPRILLMF